MSDPNIAKAYRSLREAIARETAKLPAVDHNGQPIDPARNHNPFTRHLTKGTENDN